MRIRGRNGRMVAALAGGLAVGGWGLASLSVARAAAPMPASTYGKEIQPLLRTYCGACHNAQTRQGQVDFSAVADEAGARHARKLWRKCAAQLEAMTMPPAGQKQPSTAERQRLLGWMQKTANAFDPHDPAGHDPGPAVIRRLSLAEYNNTIHDLLGFEFNGADAVGMTDDSGTGNTFGNLAAALDIPPALLDKYFAAADKVLDRYFGTELRSDVDERIRDAARLHREHLFQVKPGSWNKAEAKIEPPEGMTERDAARKILETVLPRAYRHPVDASEVERVLKVYDFAAAKGQGYVGSVRLALKAVLVSPRFLYRIEDEPARPGTAAAYAVDDYDLASRLSYFLWSTMPDDTLLELAAAHKLSAPGPSDRPTRFGGSLIGGGAAANRDDTREKADDGDLYTFFEGTPGSWVGLDLGKPHRIAELRYAGFPRYNFGTRMVGGKFQASNQPDFSGEVTDLATVTAAPPPGETVRVPVAASGTFQYVRFLGPAGKETHIAELEVWGPGEGTVLEQQVRRMLADPRARALTRNFAANWLEIRSLPAARPSSDYFPEFQPDVRKAMYDETFTFFDALRQHDRSVFDLLDADYTYLNEELAKFYKIPGVSGKEMRQVELKPEYHRGGLLGMGSVLALTSATARTSPTLRGKYVLDVIFGTPPPPPPANAGMFKDDQDKAKQPKSFRERMALHATDPACASCHRKMDPLGYALENYNAVGQWRESDHGQPVESAAELPTGEKFNGAVELKKVIRDHREQFVRSIAGQMLTYALGRELDDYDEGPLRQIEERMQRSDYRFSALVAGIVESYPFRNRRDPANSAQAESKPAAAPKPAARKSPQKGAH